MLVHVCCSVDSHYFLQELMKQYPDDKLIAFFYNPNIHPKEEYDLRLLDVKRSCNILNVELIEGNYDIVSWLDRTYGFEDEEEKGHRCSLCFDERLIKTAMLALEINETKITTTLLASPMKSKEELFAQGDNIIANYGLDFIKIDVRSGGGTQRQSKMAKEANLYRQNYCGCQYALKKQRDRSNKVSIELFSNIGNQIQYGSIKHMINVFKTFYSLESSKKPCLLQKKSITIYRLLTGSLKYNNTIIPSYIFANSKSCKNLKSGNISWHNINVDGNIVNIGFCDNMYFIDIKSINIVFGKDYKDVFDMIYNPPEYSMELEYRIKLSGFDSIKPIIVVDSIIESGATLTIDAIFQTSDIFEVIKL